MSETTGACETWKADGDGVVHMHEASTSELDTTTRGPVDGVPCPRTTLFPPSTNDFADSVDRSSFT